MYGEEYLEAKERAADEAEARALLAGLRPGVRAAVVAIVGSEKAQAELARDYDRFVASCPPVWPPPLPMWPSLVGLFGRWMG